MSSRIAIVTGSSRGIGAATARLAAGAGYAVCVNYLESRGAAEAVVHRRLLSRDGLRPAWFGA